MPTPYVMRPSDKGIFELRDNYLPDNCVMAEIGCYAGESTKIWLCTNKIKLLFCIDPWQNGYDNDDYASFTCSMEDVERIFDEVIADDLRVSKLKRESLDASMLFDNEYFDFVYIDGNHTYEFVKQDIETWIKKIKIGGYIGGHDYLGDDDSPIKRAIHETIGVPDVVFSDSSWIKKISI